MQGVVVSESCECVCYIGHHLQVYLVVAVVTIKIQPQIPFVLPIVVSFLVLHVVFSDIFHTKIINAE